jgi:arylsulfatase A-like enzyme
MFGAPGRRAKNIFYDEAVRVPFLMSWKGRLDEGAECDACLSACDIMPTILSMMDLPVPDSAEGYDFSRVAFGKKDIEEPSFALMQCTGATADWEGGHEWRALRGKRFTYAVYLVDSEEFLFDNHNDPLQQHNLIDSPGYEKMSDDFRKAISKKMHEIGDTFEKCTWYRDNWTNDRVILKSSES